MLNFNTMKLNVCILAFVGALLLTACQNGLDSGTGHYYWMGDKGELIMTKYGNVFRGEFIDYSFKDRMSVPVFGLIDRAGNVTGVGTDVLGSIFAHINGKITDNTFEVVWFPAPNAMDVSDFIEMTMKRHDLPPEVESEIDKHPDAFYNWLFLDEELENRVTPFLAEKTTLSDGRLYGYQISEWEEKFLQVATGSQPDEVVFRLQIESCGMYDLIVDISGTTRLSGNTFRYKDKGYEFEVALYNGFAAITTLAGSLDTGGQDTEGVPFLADGVYPMQLKDNVNEDNKAFSQLMMDIVLRLPVSVMPHYLKTEAQRREKMDPKREEGKNYIYVGDEGNYNCLHYTEFDGDYSYLMWEMAGYLSDDHNNITVIVQYGTLLDGFSLRSDKTLNYNIKTKECVAIKRPFEPPAVNEMVLEELFENRRIYQKALTHFSQKMELIYNFNCEGFYVVLNDFEFWTENSEDYDYYTNPFVKAFYKWDGKQFVKDRFERNKNEK
jgi:hypothetical protein